jgi:hypothetical protein
MRFFALHKPIRSALLVSLSLALGQAVAPIALAQTAAFTQSLAATASSDEAIAEWYRKAGYEPLWTGADDADRRSAFLAAIATAKDHGLPVPRYDPVALTAGLQAAGGGSRSR